MTLSARRTFAPIALLRAALPLAIASGLVVACTVTTNGGAGGVDGGSPTPDSGASGQLGFSPSNVDLSGLDLSTIGDFVAT